MSQELRNLRPLPLPTALALTGPAAATLATTLAAAAAYAAAAAAAAAAACACDHATQGSADPQRRHGRVGNIKYLHLALCVPVSAAAPR